MHHLLVCSVKNLTTLILGWCCLMALPAHAQQVVFLDFDSGSNSGIIYTAAMRNQVQTLMEGHYAPWNFIFVQSAPATGQYSTVTFNEGNPGGVAQHIDPLNSDNNDTAVVNINGLGLSSTEDIVYASANIGSHELGHLQGLRHGNSWGPIGGGTTASGVGMLPDFPGPYAATETANHIMASPASVGSTIADATTPLWFSERSAIKLTNNECHSSGTCSVQGEGALTLDSLSIPNTIETGTNAGKSLHSDVFTARGEISTAGEIDGFTFFGEAGDIWAFETWSNSVQQAVGNVVDTIITLLFGGVPIDYYGTPSRNDDEIETFDSWILDLVLPATGLYSIDVSAYSPFDTGSYYLFGYNFTASEAPVPATIFLVLLGLMLLNLRRPVK